jgi:hypothetical protein
VKSRKVFYGSIGPSFLSFAFFPCTNLSVHTLPT